ncbi:MAG TPA: amylo-alpha-1,6-glucosidase, partial [Pyrinomonadaceae bacterium]|nr:amylo-alpha-1,6-glucosidase [Pyrinomonadaceae bacterium]
DGLLYAGEPGHQLTWMAAKIGDLVISPRIGKPVEIQALWYNALRIMADLADRFGHDEDKQRFVAMADLAKLSFNGLFWNEDEHCLYDVIADGTGDPAVRPNQILAVSLAHPILERRRWKPVVDKVREELLTPVGLRSLSPIDPAYVPHYLGSPFARDSAYHQGTVWGWLIGPFIDAFRKAYAEEEAEVAAMLSGFEAHLCEAGLGQVSEIFDAEPPYAPRGCPAQAWSVAELLRVLRA